MSTNCMYWYPMRYISVLIVEMCQLQYCPCMRGGGSSIQRLVENAVCALLHDASGSAGGAQRKSLIAAAYVWALQQKVRNKNNANISQAHSEISVPLPRIYSISIRQRPQEQLPQLRCSCVYYVCTNHHSRKTKTDLNNFPVGYVIDFK